MNRIKKFLHSLIYKHPSDMPKGAFVKGSSFPIATTNQAPKPTPEAKD